MGRFRPGGGDRGAAVVEFVLVAMLLVLLLLAVLQVAVYLYVRNVAAASAAEGARFGANADLASAAAAQRATGLLRVAAGRRVAAGLPCSAGEEPGAAGSTLVVVRCRGAVPVFFAPLGRALPLTVTARALKEGR